RSSRDWSSDVCSSDLTHFQRFHPLHILFIHRDAETVECCLQELKKAQFIVSADIALNLAQCAELLRSQSYDVVAAEYPSPSWKEIGSASCRESEAAER